MKSRELLFWALDFIKGSKVREAYNDIKKVIEHGTTCPLDERLSLLLNEATNNTKFYSEFKNKSFDKFPVVNKSFIKDNLSNFISQKYDINQLKKVTTSGSTGTPFTVYQNQTKRIRHSADNIYFMNEADYFLGCKLYSFRVWNSLISNTFLARYGQNIYRVEVSNLSATKINEILTEISSDPKPKTMLAFASTYDIIIKHIIDNNISIPDSNVIAIVSMSESLPKDTRNHLKDFFNAPVVSRYSNMENGFIAQQPKNEDYYIINRASFKVELLSLIDDSPVELGKTGRIVITDYYNYAMPLIRYDTGDLGIFESKLIKGKEEIVLSSIEGRKVDMIFTTQGDIISPHTITNTMWKFPTLKQWQFHQIDRKDYKFIINGHFTENDSIELTRTMKNYLGNDANISYEFTNDIPVLASGKRKKIVNSYV